MRTLRQLLLLLVACEKSSLAFLGNTGSWVSSFATQSTTSSTPLLQQSPSRNPTGGVRLVKHHFSRLQDEEEEDNGAAEDKDDELVVEELELDLEDNSNNHVGEYDDINAGDDEDIKFQKPDPEVVQDLLEQATELFTTASSASSDPEGSKGEQDLQGSIHQLVERIKMVLEYTTEDNTDHHKIPTSVSSLLSNSPAHVIHTLQARIDDFTEQHEDLQWRNHGIKVQEQQDTNQKGTTTTEVEEDVFVDAVILEEQKRARMVHEIEKNPTAKSVTVDRMDHVEPQVDDDNNNKDEDQQVIAEEKTDAQKWAQEYQQEKEARSKYRQTAVDAAIEPPVSALSIPYNIKVLLEDRPLVNVASDHATATEMTESIELGQEVLDALQESDEAFTFASAEKAAIRSEITKRRAKMVHRLVGKAFGATVNFTSGIANRISNLIRSRRGRKNSKQGLDLVPPPVVTKSQSSLETTTTPSFPTRESQQVDAQPECVKEADVPFSEKDVAKLYAEIAPHLGGRSVDFAFLSAKKPLEEDDSNGPAPRSSSSTTPGKRKTTFLPATRSSRLYSTRAFHDADATRNTTAAEAVDTDSSVLAKEGKSDDQEATSISSEGDKPIVAKRLADGTAKPPKGVSLGKEGEENIDAFLEELAKTVVTADGKEDALAKVMAMLGDEESGGTDVEQAPSMKTTANTEVAKDVTETKVMASLDNERRGTETAQPPSMKTTTKTEVDSDANEEIDVGEELAKVMFTADVTKGKTVQAPSMKTTATSEAVMDNGEAKESIGASKMKAATPAVADKDMSAAKRLVPKVKAENPASQRRATDTDTFSGKRIVPEAKAENPTKAAAGPKANSTELMMDMMQDELLGTVDKATEDIKTEGAVQKKPPSKIVSFEQPSDKREESPKEEEETVAEKSRHSLVESPGTPPATKKTKTATASVADDAKSTEMKKQKFPPPKPKNSSLEDATMLAQSPSAKDSQGFSKKTVKPESDSNLDNAIFDANKPSTGDLKVSPTKQTKVASAGLVPDSPSPEMLTKKPIADANKPATGDLRESPTKETSDLKESPTNETSVAPADVFPGPPTPEMPTKDPVADSGDQTGKQGAQSSTRAEEPTKNAPAESVKPKLNPTVFSVKPDTMGSDAGSPNFFGHSTEPPKPSDRFKRTMPLSSGVKGSFVGLAPDKYEMVADNMGLPIPLEEIYQNQKNLEKFSGGDAPQKKPTTPATPDTDLVDDPPKASPKAYRMMAADNMDTNPLEDIYRKAPSVPTERFKKSPSTTPSPNRKVVNESAPQNLPNPSERYKKTLPTAKAIPAPGADSGDYSFTPLAGDSQDIRSPLSDIYTHRKQMYEPKKERSSASHIRPIGSPDSSNLPRAFPAPLEKSPQTGESKSSQTGESPKLPVEPNATNSTLATGSNNDENENDNEPPAKPAPVPHMNKPVSFFDIQRAWVHGNNNNN